MYDLTAFRARIAALYRRATPYDGRKPTQQDLADAVGLSRTELSRRLNGLQHARLTSRDVQAIIQTLAAWGAISTQAQARELLALVDCPDFTPAEWDSPPLDELIPAASPAPPAAQTSTVSPQSPNLPRPTTSFVGRERELPEVTSLIRTRRLVTLTGTGGVGKSRLALEVAARVAGGFGDGVYWVGLASVRDPANVAPAIAAALDVEEKAGESLDETLRRHLQHRDLLLLLDNCEHLAVAVSMLVSDLLGGCPRLHILATSREPLRLTKEARYALSPLPLPPHEVGLSVERIAEFAAVQLFVARATAARDSFHLTTENVAAVHYICTQLDGLPLALELAAARVQLMTAVQIAAQLAERFRLLTDRHADVHPRHQTLIALLDWSYGLLTTEEQAIFRALAVFSGGFTLEAAAATMNAAPLDVLDQLSELLNKSLIYDISSSVAEGRSGGDEPRFTMLETVREYALLKLREAGEEQVARQAHAAYYRQLAEQAAPELAGSQQILWLERLEQEYPNLSSAVDWSLEHEADAAAALQISGGLWRFWQAHGRVSEIRQWLDRALARSASADPVLTAEAMETAGRLAYLQGDFPTARQHFEATLSLRRELADERGTTSVLNNLGAVAAAQGDYQFSHYCYEQGLTVMRRLNNKVGIGISLHNLGLVSAIQGDYPAARSLFEQALAVRRELGSELAIALTLTALGDTAYDQDDYTTADAFYQEAFTLFQAGGDKWQLSYTLTYMGRIATALGDYSRALLLHRQGLQLHQEMGDQLGIINFIEGMALLAQAKQQPERAARLWGAANAQREILKSPTFGSDRPRHERSIADLRAVLGTTAFARAWVAGQVMNQDQAVAYALDDQSSLSDEVTFP